MRYAVFYANEITELSFGQECLNMLLENNVDVCLLDINMPGMDGLEVLRRIKSGQPGLKVVMLSALSQERNVKRALLHTDSGSPERHPCNYWPCYY